MRLTPYEAGQKQSGPRDRRFRLEHADIVAAQDLPRFAKLSVLVSMQPSFCCGDIGANFDPEDKTPTDRWNSLQQSGALLAFGSDWPCTWPPDPFVSIQETVRRQVWRSPNPNSSPGWIFDGAGQAGSVTGLEVYVPEEKISVERAVNAYTKSSSFARFSEDRLRTLEPWKEDDLAVRSQDIFSINHQRISNTKRLMNMVA